MSELRYYRDFSLIVMSRIIEKEFGKEALDLLVEWKNKKTEEEWKKRGQDVKDKNPRNFLSLFSKEAHDFEIVRADEETLEVIVKKCVHAEIFKKFNATDVGKKLICDSDYFVVKGFNSEIELKRDKLLMLGDNCCHFIFKLKK